MTELIYFLSRKNVLVACIQETKLKLGSRLPSFPGNASIRQDRVGGGGGFLTLVHHSVNFSQDNSPINDGPSEVLIVQISLAGNQLNIANVYIPPASSTNLPPNFHALLTPLFALADTVVLGDINCHNGGWYRGISDIRGDRLAGKVDTNNYSVLNNPNIPTRPCSDTSPDVAFVPTPWALSFDWIASTSLNSDHLPISLLITDEVTPPRGGRSYTNFRKAKWEEFKRETKSLFSSLPLPSSCATGEKEWRRVLQKSSARNIRAGYHHTFVPGLDTISASLIAERESRRALNPNNPEIASQLPSPPVLARSGWKRSKKPTVVQIQHVFGASSKVSRGRHRLRLRINRLILREKLLLRKPLSLINFVVNMLTSKNFSKLKKQGKFISL